MQTKVLAQMHEGSKALDLSNPNLDVAERNHVLDTALNPNGDLPKVRLERIPMATAYLDRGFAIYNDLSEAIGTVHYSLPEEPKGENFARMRSVGIANGYTGQGNGRATYLEVLKLLPQGVGLKSSDVSLTRGSLLLWRWLEDNSVATSNDPERNALPDYQGHYIGLEYKTLFGNLQTISGQVQEMQPKQVEESSLIVRATQRLFKRN